jgi:hypothetical protein
VIAAVVLVSAGCPSPTGEGEGEGGGTGEGEGEGEGDIGPGVAGDVCSFNADCGAALRCGCVDGACACEAGARGIGQSGVDACTTGNDCASALCIEDNLGGFTCSGACATATDCAAKLPICSDIAFVGRVCIRDPNG